MTEKKYSYSTDEEFYHGQYNSRDAALAAAEEEVFDIDDAPDDTRTVFTAENVPVVINYHNAVEAALEDIEQAVYDEAGESAESFVLTGNAVLIDRLTAAIKPIIEEIATEKFWTVTNVEEHTLTVPHHEG